MLVIGVCSVLPRGLELESADIESDEAMDDGLDCNRMATSNCVFDMLSFDCSPGFLRESLAEERLAAMAFFPVESAQPCHVIPADQSSAFLGMNGLQKWTLCIWQQEALFEQ